jgi:hypothetical protein
VVSDEKYPKSNCKCCVSTPVAVGFPRAPSREIPDRSVMGPGGDGYCLRDYGVEKEISSLGCLH